MTPLIKLINVLFPSADMTHT